MNVAIDISPLKTGNFLSHRVRGTGQYLENLRASLEKYFPENNYTYFTREDKISNKLDVVHYPYFEPFFLTLPFSINKKSVVTVHDFTPFVFPKKFPSGIKGKLRWQVQKFNLKRAGAIITDSECSKNDIVKFAGIDKSKISVVYLAAGESFRVIEDKSVLARVKAKFNLPDQFAVYVGDVTWNKNLPRLLEAVKLANIPLVMVGKAILEKDFDKKNLWNQDRIIVQKNLEENKNIIAVGFVSGEDLVALYNLATVFLMPSFYEGFGLPILEAMNSGCPVIASRGGSIPEVAGDAALYIDENDALDIKNALVKVFSDSKLQKQLSEKGLDQVQKFSWEKTASQTIGVYKKVVQS